MAKIGAQITSGDQGEHLSFSLFCILIQFPKLSQLCCLLSISVLRQLVMIFLYSLWHGQDSKKGDSWSLHYHGCIESQAQPMEWWAMVSQSQRGLHSRIQSHLIHSCKVMQGLCMQQISVLTMIICFHAQGTAQVSRMSVLLWLSLMLFCTSQWDFTAFSLLARIRPEWTCPCKEKLACCGVAVRLWSLRLNANLVCYKGHNYPVWDVQVILQLCRALSLLWFEESNLWCYSSSPKQLLHFFGYWVTPGFSSVNILLAVLVSMDDFFGVATVLWSLLMV
jgi:hypothetical protein